ncbi:redoxin domain-containing protein [Chitinophaga silvisoli]|uniref:Alkyl hydroperoxide reductase subunit C/ Thiol specific antioxidant domain-containing protein n=1 Tax=Chitinophaga silvisoli TaxID=2291814 RepID=A0A3E1NYK6_9BACT|nr:redoxin domain-containing protein [Chitinophaga silvisoli]RFM32944.1 hypothetical protein DXN04_21145 [Chitinophaga silvisoli]
MKLSTFLFCCLSLQTMQATAQYDSQAEFSQDRIKTQGDPAIMEKMTRTFEAKYGDADRAKVYLVEAYADRADMNKVRYWLKDFKNQTFQHQAACSAVRILLTNKHYKEAEVLLQPYLHLDLTKEDANGYMGPTLLVYKDDAIRFFYYYAEVQYHKGNYKTAMRYMQAALDVDKGHTFFDFRQRELLALLYMHMGKTSEASMEMHSLISGAPDRNKEFMAAAKKCLPDYQQKVASATAWLYKRIKDETLKKMQTVNIQVPDIQLKDEKGNGFSLSSLRGKTVFIYFWTIDQTDLYDNSFPVLQRVKESYANNPDVVFICIHTYEAAASTATDVANYLDRKGYNLDLYLDLKDPVTKKNPMATALHLESANLERAWEGDYIILNKEGIGKVKRPAGLLNEMGYQVVHGMIDAVRENPEK